MIPSRTWSATRACYSVCIEVFFPEGSDLYSMQTHQRRGGHPQRVLDALEVAKGYCRTCPVREECLDRALAQGEQFGVFGGLDALERDVIIRARRSRVDAIVPILGALT